MTVLTARHRPPADWRAIVRAARVRRRPVPAATARPGTSTGEPRPGPLGPERVLAAAIRLELTHPGSVPAAQQCDLILADRAAAGGRHPGPPDGAWTPFRSDTDPCPYRPLTAGSWNGPGRSPVSPSSPAPWWARPAAPAG